MNNEQLKNKVVQASEFLLKEKNFISPVDLLISVGVLTKSDYEAWRTGRVSYLERVCTVNLNKLALIMKELKEFALRNKLVPSRTLYNRWGTKQKISLIFSKNGNENIEKLYSTHYINKG